MFNQVSRSQLNLLGGPGGKLEGKCRAPTRTTHRLDAHGFGPGNIAHQFTPAPGQYLRIDVVGFILLNLRIGHNPIIRQEYHIVANDAAFEAELLLDFLASLKQRRA